MTNPTAQHIEFPSAQLISVNGIELEVFEAGKENRGKPIVLCHGFPELAYAWRHQITALANAGYHVIAPNQRGYGNSSSPKSIEEFDIHQLTADMAALLDYFEYSAATFIGHDWGANVVWNLALLHPDRVEKVINLALPYQERGEIPWVQWMEKAFGNDFYFVHFNQQPGVADAILDQNTHPFLRNLFRKNLPPIPPQPGMFLIQLALQKEPLGDAIMPDQDLEIYTQSFKKSGFTGAINWYRNLDRNWHLMADIQPLINHHTLMIYGAQDVIPPSPTLKNFAPNLTEVVIDCGHWIQQEKPEETNRIILEWLAQH